MTHDVRRLASFLGVLMAWGAYACSGDGGGGAAAGGSSGSGGDTSTGGSTGGSGGKNSGSGGKPGGSSATGGSSSGGSSGAGGSGTDASSATGGSSSTGGSPATGGTSGDGGTSDASASTLCDKIAQLQVKMAGELGCSGDPNPEANAQRRLCAAGVAYCESELQTMYDCKLALAASKWSCDTTDGHPQTNAFCSSAAFFTCLQTAVHTHDPYGCAATAAEKNAAADTLACSHDDQLENMCNQLYFRALCVSEWEALVACLKTGALADNLQCDTADGGTKLVTKTGVCTAERAAFDTCMPN